MNKKEQTCGQLPCTHIPQLNPPENVSIVSDSTANVPLCSAEVFMCFGGIPLHAFNTSIVPSQFTYTMILMSMSYRLLSNTYLNSSIQLLNK